MPEKKAIHKGIRNCSQSPAGPPTACSRMRTADGSAPAAGGHRSPRGTAESSQSHAGPPRSCACGMDAPSLSPWAILACTAWPVRRGDQTGRLGDDQRPRSRGSTCIGTTGGTPTPRISVDFLPASHSSDTWARPGWHHMGPTGSLVRRDPDSPSRKYISSWQHRREHRAVGRRPVDHVDRCRLSTAGRMVSRGPSCRARSVEGGIRAPCAFYRRRSQITALKTHVAEAGRASPVARVQPTSCDVGCRRGVRSSASSTRRRSGPTRDVVATSSNCGSGSAPSAASPCRRRPG